MDIHEPIILKLKSVPALIVDGTVKKSVKDLVDKKSIYKKKNKPLGVILDLDQLIEQNLLDRDRLSDLCGIGSFNKIVNLLELFEDLAFVRVPIYSSKWIYSERLIDKETSILQYITFSGYDNSINKLLHSLDSNFPVIAATSFNPHGDPLPENELEFEEYKKVMDIEEVLDLSNQKDKRKGSFPIVEFDNHELNVAREGNIPTQIIRAILKDVLVVQGYEGVIGKKWQDLVDEIERVEIDGLNDTLNKRKSILMNYIYS